jgi:hypothetical protein
MGRLFEKEKKKKKTHMQAHKQNLHKCRQSKETGATSLFQRVSKGLGDSLRR